MAMYEVVLVLSRKRNLFPRDWS